MKKHILIVLLVLISTLALKAAYFERVPITLIQPNGDTLRCFATGDDYYQWLHDDKNFTIIMNVENGFYVYANLVEEQLVPTALIPGIDQPGLYLVPGINISAEKMLALRKQMEDQVPKTENNTRSLNRGMMNNLVLFIRFSDDTEFTTPFSEVDQKFNDSSSVNAVSMYNYVKNVSYQQMYVLSHFYPAPNVDQILSYQDIFPRDYYLPYSGENTNGYQNNDTVNQRTEREHALLERAVDFIKNSIPSNIDFDYDDDGKIDNISFVIKGEVGDWADLLWPHRWSLFSDSLTINDLRVWDYNFLLANSGYFSASTMSHELLHTFGFPDLYRYAYNGTPVGSWDIMAGNANPPQQSNMYCKWKYGNWIEEIPEITEAGFYTLYPNQNNHEGSVYKIASSNPDEFFILEFRRKLLPFDSGISNSGVLIYRINSLYSGNAGTNLTDVFDEVYLYRYNGTPEMDGVISAATFYLNNPLLNTFNPWTNPNPFLTDGTVCFFELNQFTNKNADSITFYYNPQPISIHENSILSQDLRIYPNPAQELLTVEFAQPIEADNSYIVYDATGKEVMNGVFNETKQAIDISTVGIGFYLIKIQNPRETKTYKFLKN
jgi:M6 family metalloprotease-like protein